MCQVETLLATLPFPAKFSPRDGGGIVCLAIPKTLTRVNSPSQVTLVRFGFFRQVLNFELCFTLGANKRLLGLAHTVV